MTEEPWNPFSRYLRDRFGERVHRIGLDAGMTCPNRDGTRGRGGCVFCDEGGSRAEYQDPTLPIRDQMRLGMARMERRFGARKFIAYFQAYTNTYAPVGRLRALWEEALVDDRVVALAAGTRPDCVSPAVVEVLKEFSGRLLTWAELGFLSRDQAVLEACNRGEDVAEFERAARRLHEAGIPVCAHVVLGLPGESLEEAAGSVELMNELGIDGIKFHNLYIVEDAPIAGEWRNGKVRVPEREEYALAVCNYLERLRPECWVHRLTGDASRARLLAPEWMLDKNAFLRVLREEFARRGTRQGSRFTGARVSS